ncbi:MAG: RHS repeat-associated core domain-containing protein, partial [Chryseobacterium sp.]|nr:RHS repeat-associated core domain-containing protein [Chryseobacterium sp.]
FPSTILGQTIMTDTQNASVNTQAMPTLGLVKNMEDDNWTKSYAYYDTKGRSVGTYTINHLGGSTKTETELDFAGVAKQTKVYHKRLPTDTEKVISQSFEYDNQNRVMKHRHQVGSGPVEMLTENTYNELSQLSNKKVGGGLESIDYQYDIRGALTKVNDPAALGTRLFGYSLKYQNPEYANVAPGKSNGNISEVDWKSASDGILKRYSYVYDPLNRLKDAIYAEPGSTVPHNNNYNEYVTYDLHGNIKTLQRNAFPVFGTTSTLVDNLVYEYTGNRLDKVIENAMNDTGYEGGNNVIDYDVNGNMTTMKDKGIQSIGYNFLNLPDHYAITQTTILGTNSYSLDYLYRADGTKLRKTYFAPSSRRGSSDTTSITDYLDGFQYSYNDLGGGLQPCLTCRTESAYEEQAYKKMVIPGGGAPEWKLDFVPTAEGFYSFTENRYIYQYKDHLGNTRVSFARNSAGAPEILDTNNYYPFGLNHTGGNGINSSGFGSWQSYKYNGKELQETGMYDYGARFYMSDLGRWGVIDPLAEQMRRYSPYNYAFNNPVSFIDPDGRKPRTHDAEEASVMYPKSLWGFFMQGGQKDTTALIDFIAQNNGVGSFQNIMNIMESSGGISNSSSKSSGGNDKGAATESSNTDDSMHFQVPTVFVTAKKGYNMDKLHDAMTIAFERVLDNADELFYKIDNASKGLMRYQTEDFFQDADSHLNGSLGIVGMALDGYKKLPN